MASRPAPLLDTAPARYTEAALNRPLTLLGGLSPAQFMRRYWHRQPLLIRQALAPGKPVIERDALFALADLDEVEARLITRPRARGREPGWSLRHGPFARDELPSVKTRLWTLLVQGVNLHHAAADALMQQFRFISDARLDDVMISYASDGGGVGPHFDSYDVFLLQLHGKRRWRISTQKDLTLKSDLPLKVLQNFVPEQEWLLEPGDMLYLPPHVAHDGVAEGETMTASIGFRAPRAAEIRGQFLYDLAERCAEGDDAARYADAGEPPTAHPGRVPPHLVERLGAMIAKIRWSERDVAHFAGRYLSEPKATVFFEPPVRALSATQFLRGLQQRGVRLDARTRLLYDGHGIYINGENVEAAATIRPRIRELADARALAPQSSVTLSHHSPVTQLLYEWYLAGWMHLN
jgi:50S ribosomal protein L16 3-hydroxylase